MLRSLSSVVRAANPLSIRIFSIASGDWPPGRKLDIKIEIIPHGTNAGTVVLNEKALILNGEPNDDGFLELEKSYAFAGGSHKAYSGARASFRVYDESDGIVTSVTQDTLLVRRNT